MSTTPPAGVTFDFSKAVPIETGAAIPKSSSGAPATAVPAPSQIPKAPAGVTFDFSKAEPINPSPEYKFSRTLQNMTYAMSGQTGQMHPEDKAEFDRGVKAGVTSAAITTATGAVSGALAPLTAPTVTGTEAVGTGILDATGKEIFRDVTTYGPSVARQIFSHPLTQSLLARAAGYAGAGYILKTLGLLGK